MTRYTKTFAEAMKEVRKPKVVKEDYEVSMAIGQLRTINEYATKLISILESKGSEYDIEAWVQSKITTAEDYMNSVGHYMENNPDVANEALDKDRNTGDKHKGVEKDSKDEVQSLKDQIQMLKLELENEKNATVKPEPNPLTGEVPLRTGVASALLAKDGPKPDVEKASKTDVKLSKKKSKVEINPDVEMGVYSGGNKMNQGNLY